VIERARLWRGLAVLIVLVTVVAMPLCTPPKHPTPLTSGQTWALGELGLTELLVPDYVAPSDPAWWIWLVTVVTLASASILVGRSAPRGAVSDRFLLLQVAGQFLLIALMWLFFDRYALTLVPIVMVMVLRAGPIARPRVTAALIVAMGLLSLVGVRDHLAYNRALWDAVQHLWASGVKPADFDGGYVVNGWLQYAHPEHARRDPAGSAQVSNVNTRTRTDYRISNHAPEGWRIVSSFAYTRWAGRSGRVYVLEREG
jgi:hypothetical protein